MHRYHYDWVAYTAAVLACWEVIEQPDGTSLRQMVRLMVIGEVDSTNIRAIPLRLIATADPSEYPTWSTEVPSPLGLGDSVPAPPQQDDVDEAWRRRGPAQEVRKVSIGPRRRDESVDDFYRRVAEAYRALGADSGTPTTSLANLAGVTKDVAARWVGQARKRGYLPPTRRGKVTR